MVCMDPESIYRNFTSQALGTGGLTAAQAEAQNLGKAAAEDAESLRNLANSLSAGWSGAAAEHAGSALDPLVRDLTEFAVELDTAQDLIGRQVESFHATANRVTPVPPQPTLPDVAAFVVAGTNPTTMLDQYHQFVAAANNNVDAMASYQNDSAYNTSNLPTMEPDLQPGAATATAVPPSATKPVPSSHRAPAVPSSHGSQTTSPAAATSSAPAPPAPPAVPAPPSTTAPPTVTAPAPQSATVPTSAATSLPPSAALSPSASLSASLSPSASLSTSPQSATGTGARLGSATVSPTSTADPGLVLGGNQQSASPRSEASAPADEPASPAGMDERTASTTEPPLGGLAGRPVDRGDREHRRRYPYEEDVDELFLGGLPQDAAHVLDADPSGAE